MSTQNLEFFDFPVSMKHQESQKQQVQFQQPPKGIQVPQATQAYFYQIPQGCTMMFQPQPQPMPAQPIYSQQYQMMQFPQQVPMSQLTQEEAPEKPKRKQQFLTRGERRFILSGFAKDQLACMHLGKKNIFGSTKEQLVRSAVEITSSRDDILDLILSACDSTEED